MNIGCFVLFSYILNIDVRSGSNAILQEEEIDQLNGREQGSISEDIRNDIQSSSLKKNAADERNDRFKGQSEYEKYFDINSKPPALSPIIDAINQLDKQQNDDVNQQQLLSLLWDSSEKLETIPSADQYGLIYLMNALLVTPAYTEDFLAMFFLTHEYLRPEHGLHAWPTGKVRNRPSVYGTLPKTTILDLKQSRPFFHCVFRLKDGSFMFSQVSFVPNNTTRDRYVNDATEVMRCAVPSLGSHQISEVLLTQKIGIKKNIKENDEKSDFIKRVNIRFEIDIEQGSAISMITSDRKLLEFKERGRRKLSLCMPPLSEPLPFIAENIAHHLNVGVQHIYIGTHFDWNKREQYYDLLLQRVQPFIDAGEVTIWKHEQHWLQFTDKAKSHWLNQCLYYAKSRDEFTLSLDADELLVLPNPQQISYDAVKLLFDRDGSAVGSGEWCWLAFGSFQVWKLWDPSATLMSERFFGRESKAQYTWSKVIWNTDLLFYTGYHAGGSCVRKGRPWSKTVLDWRQQRDKENVYRFQEESQGSIWHFYNSRHIRIEPEDKKHRNPWSALVNDSSLIQNFVPRMKATMQARSVPLSFDYPSMQDYSDFDVMLTDYYLTHYGRGQSMAHWRT